MYSKNLAETEEEIEEIERKYKNVMSHISKLKEDITTSEQKLTNEYFNANQLERNCQSM